MLSMVSWVVPSPWVAIGISTVALLLSMAVFVVTVKTYRRGGARVHVFSPDDVQPSARSIFRLHQGIWMRAHVRNAGLAAVQLVNARWEVRESGRFRLGPGQHRPDRKTSRDQAEDRAVFPQTVAGHHLFAWKTVPPEWDPDKTGASAYRMRLVVHLGNGRVARSQ